MRRTRQIALFMLLGWVQQGPAAWHHLRGPNMDGSVRIAESGLSPGATLPVLWTRDIGQGFSGVVSDGTNLFTQSQSISGQQVLSLEMATGRIRWKHRYEWPWMPDGLHPGPYATPTLWNRRVYFTGCFGTLGCLDADTGEPLWKVDLAADVGLDGTDFGYACTPLVTEERVYVATGGREHALACFDALGGKLLWQSPAGLASYSSPIIVSVQGRKQVVCFLQNSLDAFDPETGDRLWSDDWSKGYDEHAVWPIYKAPLLLVSAPFRKGSRALKLSGGADTANIERLWASDVLSQDVLSATVVDGYVYGFDVRGPQADEEGTVGVLCCVELATGRACWQTERVKHASVIALNDTLVLLEETGTLVLARATPDSYVELSRHTVFYDERCWTQPTYSQGRLFVRGRGALGCVRMGRDPGGADPAETESVPLCVTGKTFRMKPDDTHWARWIEPRGVDFLHAYITCMACLLISSGTHAAWMAFRRGHRGTVGAATVAGSMAVVFALSLSTVPITRGIWVAVGVPVALFVAFVTVAGINVRASRAPTRGRVFAARLSTVVFGLACVALHAGLRSVGLPTLTGFPVGLLPSWPATRRLLTSIERHEGTVKPAAWLALAFSLFFWPAAAFILWRTR